MSDEVLDLLPQTQPPVRATPQPPGLVFVGFRLSWDARFGDISLLSSLAESWENTFSHWTLTEDSIHAGHSAIGYCVDLKAGETRFTLQIPDLAFGVAERQLTELVQTLRGRGRKRMVITLTAQFLHPETAEFGDLMLGVSQKLFNLTFLERIGAELGDMSYMMDLMLGGEWFQVSVGVLSAHEVPDRVASSKIGQVPEVSLFIAVTTRWEIPDADTEFSTHLQKVIQVAQSVAMELRA